MPLESANFVALDFETANADFSSVCQVGIVVFEHGVPAQSFSSLVDPEDDFSGLNISIHGIDEEAVRGAPNFRTIHPEITRLLRGQVTVSHSTFDRTALKQAEVRHGLLPIECRWLDTTRVVRRVWSQYSSAGYGLRNLTADFGIKIRHHDATEDARGTGQILVRAINESAVGLDDWLIRAYKPLSGAADHKIARDGNPEGPLYGDVVVFTGALAVPRHEAASKASALGLTVDGGVTKRTTLLVVGDQDVSRLAIGSVKSSKHQKAEALIANGQGIRVLRESDFLALCDQ